MERSGSDPVRGGGREEVATDRRNPPGERVLRRCLRLAPFDIRPVSERACRRDQAHPICFNASSAFQIFVMCEILPPSNCMT